MALLLSAAFTRELWPLFFENGKPDNIHDAIIFLIKALIPNVPLMDYLLRVQRVHGISTYRHVTKREIGCLPNTHTFHSMQQKTNLPAVNKYLAFLLYRHSHPKEQEFEPYFNEDIEDGRHDHSCDLLECLLKAGADPNHVIEYEPHCGLTPMHVAAQNGFLFELGIFFLW